MGWWGFGGEASSSRRQGSLGAESLALGDFCNFSIKMTDFMHISAKNSYFKAITHQLKVFKINLNVLNKLQVL